MAVPYHTHTFDIPTATNAEAAAGTRSDVALTPSNMQSVVDNLGASTGYPTIAIAEAANIPPPVHAIEVYGDATVGDGLGGLYIDTNNGASETFISGDGRTWYLAADIREERLTSALAAKINGAAQKAQNLADLTDKAAARLNLKIPVYVADRTTLKALDTTKDAITYLKEDGREGIFEWTAGDFSAQITADTQEGVYIKADAIASTAGAWVRSGVVEVLPKWFGAAVDGVTDDTVKIQAAATIAGLIGADLRFTAGQHVFDPANGTALSMATYAYGDASLQACLVLPYKTRVRTAGTATEFLFTNMNSTTSVGIAIAEDGATGAGFSQKAFTCDEVLIRAIGAHGRYGIVAPSNATLLSRKKPIYNLAPKFVGATDDLTIVTYGWTVALLLGDLVGGTIKLIGSYGTYNPNNDDTGQHQSTLFKVKSTVGAYGFDLYFVSNTFRTFIELSDGVEGFQINGEGQGAYYGIDFTNSTGEPGGKIGKVHLNVNKAGVRALNRSGLTIENLQVYRSQAYYDHGLDWSGLEAVASTIRAASVEINHADAPTTPVASSGDPALYNVNSRMARTDSTSPVRIAEWETRSVPIVWTVTGSPDCRAGDGEVNGATTIFAIIGAVTDFKGGDVSVRNVTPTNYFTTDGTADKRRLRFPRNTLIQTLLHDEIAPTAAGTTTLKPRLTVSDLQVAMQAGAGAHTYDVILDHTSAVDGDEIVVKVIGSSSANPTLRICSGSTATVLSSFNSIGGTKRLFCRYVYSAANNLWREIIADSIESTY